MGALLPLVLRFGKVLPPQVMRFFSFCPREVACRVWLFATLWTINCQTSLSTGFPRQEYWSGCHALIHLLLNFMQ